MFLAVGCELSSPHLMPVKRHFVRYLDLVQHRSLHLRKRTCLETIRTTANRWTSQPHCSRRCCLIRKVYNINREGCGVIAICMPSIYFTGFGCRSVFCLSLCCSLPVCCRCVHVSLSVLSLPLCRSIAVVIHDIRLHAYVQKRGNQPA